MTFYLILVRMIVLVLFISIILTIPTIAGEWQSQADGRWKYLEHESYVSNQWFKDTDGEWYYFDESGYMLSDQ